MSDQRPMRQEDYQAAAEENRRLKAEIVRLTTPTVVRPPKKRRRSLKKRLELIGSGWFEWLFDNASVPTLIVLLIPTVILSFAVGFLIYTPLAIGNDVARAVSGESNEDEDED